MATNNNIASDTAIETAYAVAKAQAAPVVTGPTFATATSSASNSATSGVVKAENVFYLSYRVFIEGIEVPCSGIQVEYGVSGIPTCTITLPASNMLRDLPITTKIAVFFLDLVPESSGDYKWRLLFDGEFMGYNYNVGANGSTMSLTFMHNAAHMHSMQLMVMDMTEYWVGGGMQYPAGDSTIVTQQHFNRPTRTILKGLLSKESAPNYKSMADICYTLVRTVLADTKGTASGSFFKKKFGDTATNGIGGYKLLRRFYGISEATTKMAIPEAGALDKGPDDLPGYGGSSGTYYPGKSAPANWKGKGYSYTNKKVDDAFYSGDSSYSTAGETIGGVEYRKRNDIDFDNIEVQTKSSLNKTIDTFVTKYPQYKDSIIITDGLRPGDADYGAENSWHKWGEAVDVYVDGITEEHKNELLQMSSVYFKENLKYSDSDHVHFGGVK